MIPTLDYVTLPNHLKIQLQAHVKPILKAILKNMPGGMTGGFWMKTIPKKYVMFGFASTTELKYSRMRVKQLLFGQIMLINTQVASSHVWVIFGSLKLRKHSYSIDLDERWMIFRILRTNAPAIFQNLQDFLFSFRLGVVP